MTEMTAPMMGNGQPVDERDTILEVRNLKKYFPITAGFILQRRVADIKAVDDVSFFVKRGETLGLVGESGSGQDHSGQEHPAVGEADGGRGGLRGHGHHESRPGPAAHHPAAHADHLPGPVQLAEPPDEGVGHRGRSADDTPAGQEQAGVPAPSRGSCCSRWG